MIAWQDVQALLDVYAAVVHPVFNFLDLDNFFKHCQSHWHSNSQSLAFEAVAGGVIAFASLFSGVLSEELEMAIVLHAKNVLNDPAESRSPSLNTAVGWVLRTLYVRATGRPYEAYSASLTSVSMVQAMGLHRAADSVQSAGAGGPDSIADYFNVMQRRVATVAQSLHILFSYDYGRSVLDIGLANLDQEGSDTSNYTIALQQLAQVVPLNPPTADPTAMRQYLDQALQDLLAIRCSHDFVTLMWVELGLSIYRRLRVLDFQLQKMHVQGVLELSSTATSAALRLSAQKRPWWNIVSTIFQVVCVMLSINTRESLASLAEAMGALQTVNDIFKTNLTNEALSTARLLVNACKKKKATELDLLEQAGGKDPVSSTIPEETYYLSAELDLETFLRPISDVGYFDFLDNP
ncbi:hypothetical protein E8E13_005388 [Curvularia kusanoi]|uniref:Xylanolytic transcriptional activator regulatory domain-containing protein n=1 Tax=Curvularia kusanoi TaxID=90978 RepID=A0A9P4WCG2_CURKU|nr:hypothetical protein E8E13_005388 [Curvularia kusanoi]